MTMYIGVLEWYDYGDEYVIMEIDEEELLTDMNDVDVLLKKNKKATGVTQRAPEPYPVKNKEFVENLLHDYGVYFSMSDTVLIPVHILVEKINKTLPEDLQMPLEYVMDEIGEYPKWDGGHGKCLENIRVSYAQFIHQGNGTIWHESSAKDTRADVQILVYTEHLFTKNADNVD